MAEIILSFFAVIGLLFFVIYVCDYLFYRKFDQKLILTVDTRGMTVEQCMETFELIQTVRQMTSGKAAISFLTILVESENDEKAKIAKEYLRIFKIQGQIQKEILTLD